MKLEQEKVPIFFSTFFYLYLYLSIFFFFFFSFFSSAIISFSLRSSFIFLIYFHPPLSTAFSFSLIILRSGSTFFIYFYPLFFLSFFFPLAIIIIVFFSSWSPHLSYFYSDYSLLSEFCSFCFFFICSCNIQLYLYFAISLSFSVSFFNILCSFFDFTFGFSSLRSLSISCLFSFLLLVYECFYEAVVCRLNVFSTLFFRRIIHLGFWRVRICVIPIERGRLAFTHDVVEC